MALVRKTGLIALVAACLAPAPGAAAAPITAKGPVGYDSLRRLDLLPLLRPGVQARQFSSYDRLGFNNDGVRGTYSCLRRTAAGECVIAEHDGPGEVDSLWFTRDRGVVTRNGVLRVELDGRTVVDAPLQSVVNGGLGGAFAFPLVANAFQSSGGVYVKVPMAFRSRMQITTSATPLYHHVAWRAFGDDTGVNTFDPAENAADVLATLHAAGLRDPKPAVPGATTEALPFALPPGRSITLTRHGGSGVITALSLRLRSISAPRATLPLPRTDLFRFLRVRIYFDGVRTVDAPIGEFFGSGVAPATVRALMFSSSPLAFGWLNAWWPMPYARGASISLYNGSRTSVFAADARITSAHSPTWGGLIKSGQAGHFHATSLRGYTSAGRDWPLLVRSGRGLVVGVVQSMRGATGLRGVAQRGYLEGDESVSVDGASTALYHGTGTEDFYEGGFYFLHGPFTRPLTGAPVHRVGGVACPLADCTGAYRLRVGVAIPFTRSIRFTIEHGNRNLVRGFYGSTVLWYG
jgi:hypothetical protein